MVWLLPAPRGVDINAWHLLAIFAFTIVGIISRPLPMGAIALTGIILTALTGTLNIAEALSGFSNKVIWLIVTAFFISRGFIKTGLGSRIAYLFMSILGKNSLGLAYGFACTDLVLAPAIPSNTARSGGILFPIICSTAAVYGSDPEKGTEDKIGAFLMQSSFQSQIITSAMFLTAMAANPLAAQLAGDQGVEISWKSWALAASLPGFLSLIIIPYLIYKLFPPEIKKTTEAVHEAKRKLAEMGKVKISEWIMLSVFFLLLFLWILGGYIKINSTTTALTGLGLLLLTNVLTWEDVLREKEAWNTLVWFAALVMMATYLNNLGLIPWFANSMNQVVAGLSWLSAFLILVLVYFYSHYFFASNTAHVSSMYAPFLAVAILAGTPAVLAALVLAFFSNLFSSMTHYGTGPAPVYFGSGYVKLSKWWSLGFMISVVNIIIWIGAGSLWWKFLGYW